jgi:hypothetical protein
MITELKQKTALENFQRTIDEKVQQAKNTNRRIEKISMRI